jgi:competence protein ComEC
MPLIAKACLAYAVGLFVACVWPGRVTDVVLLVTLATGVLAIAWPLSGIPREAATCALLVGGGVLIGMGATVRRATCGAAFASAGALRVSLDDDARSGAIAHGWVRGAGCDAAITLFVLHGDANAGDAVLARGVISTGDRGLLVREAIVSEAMHHVDLATLRARVGRRIDRLFRGDAPMVRALVIADMSAIPAEQRDRFASAGLVHMLSVSGLHVAIVALAFSLLASALRLPRRPADLATLLLLGAYVLLIGAPAPAVRAAVMLTLVIVTRAVQRPTSRWAILAVGSTIPLWDPALVVDLGWQLSVAGTIALVAGGALARRVVPRKWRGARRSLSTAMVISIVATVVTAPLIAWTFGRLAVLSPITNLLADPVVGLLQPLLFLAICLPWQPAEHVFVDAAHALIAVFDGIATHAAALPFAAPFVLPSASAALAGAVFAVAVIVACQAREPMRAVLVAAGAAAMMVVEPLLSVPRSTTEVHMIDVGQGDALAIRTRRDHWIVVDAGRSWDGGDAGKRTVVPYLAHRGGRVALFVLSHPHADHVGGAASLFDALPPGAFLDPGYVGTTPPYLAALAAARRDAIPWHRVHPGDSLVVDEVVVTLLAPDSAWASTLTDPNLASTVATVRIGDVRVLFTGDAEGPEEDWLLAHDAERLAADVLKVGHHGSRTSTTPAFLAAVHPRVALVSVGAQNSYGHPSAEIMDALARSGALVLRSDQLGSVVVRTDGHSMDVESRTFRSRVPPRAPW